MQAFARRPNNNNHQNPPNNHRNRNAGGGMSSPTAISTSAWFQGAPLSKLITIVVAAAYVVFEMGGLRGTTVVSLDWQAVLFEGQIYRLFLYPITFASIGELVVGLGVLCPLMRRFEREMGTRKFTSFLLFKTLPLSTIFQCLLLELSDLSDTPPEPFTPGPYPHIGALLCLYHRYTPKQHPQLFGVLGIDFSEKALTYGFALQSVTSNGWSSFLPAAVGYLAGYIASSPFLSALLGDKGWWEVVPLPGPVLQFAAGAGRLLGLDILRYAPTTGAIGPAGGGPRRGTHGTNGAGGGGGGNGQVLLPGAGGFGADRRNPRGRPVGGVGGDGAGPVLPAGAAGGGGGGGVPVAPAAGRFQAPLPPPPPAAEAVEQLTSMGFDREAVVKALQATDNNVGAAANRLLSGVS